MWFTSYTNLSMYLSQVWIQNIFSRGGDVMFKCWKQANICFAFNDFTFIMTYVNKHDSIRRNMQQSSISVDITKKSSLLFVSDSVSVIDKKTRFMVNIAFFKWLCRMILVFTNFKNNTNCINKWSFHLMFVSHSLILSNWIILCI